MTGPPMIEVLSRTCRPPDRSDVRWFNVEIRVGGVPVMSGEYTDDPDDATGRLPARSLDDAEAKTREAFGQCLSVIVTKTQVMFG